MREQQQKYVQYEYGLIMANKYIHKNNYELSTIIYRRINILETILFPLLLHPPCCCRRFTEQSRAHQERSEVRVPRRMAPLDQEHQLQRARTGFPVDRRCSVDQAEDKKK
ncbi:hypothetical protein ACQ4LE_008341 [Meloidogyne hapla]